MRILFFTEDLSEPFDEGIKKSALNIAVALAERNDVMAICKFGVPSGTLPFAVKKVGTNRLMLNMKFISLVHKFQPDAIFYLPSSSGTFASFVRMKVLSIYKKDAKSVMINLQPKKLNFIQKEIIKLIKPEIILTPSPQVLEELSSIGIKVEFLPLYIDTKRFKPIQSKVKKRELRRKHQIPIDKYIITHIGHINWGRNLESLIPLQRDDNQVVVVGSSSTPIDAPKEENLKQFLTKKGIIIIDKYIENIEEIYQLSDLYIFPVIFEGGCIGIPLSILEARACGIPVLTTDFGSIKHFLSNDHGAIFYSVPEDFSSVINQIKAEKKSYIETSVRKLNKQCLDIIFSAIEK